MNKPGMYTPQRLLITGGNGFVGKALLPRLQQTWPHASLHATSRNLKKITPSTSDQPTTHWHPLDITDATATASLIRHLQPDTVIHLAAQANVGLSFKQPQHTWHTNLQGSLNLFAAMQAHTPQACLLYISSADVYGASFASGQPVDETSLLQPLNPYAASKAAADLAAGALAATSQLKVLRLRPFNHSGPGQAEDYVLPAFAAQIARIEAGQQHQLLVGNLSAQRDFLHLQDMISAYISILHHANQLDSGSIYNICSGQPISIQNLLDIMLAQANRPIQPQQDPQRMRPSDINCVQGSYNKLAQATGWQPQQTLEQLTRDLLSDWRKRTALS